jgi:hypothetical protein
MYSTCLFCKRDMGRNEAIEEFPVGRRLAFDSAKGRLWVVCRNCERWNLSPLEERWEAIESAERIYSDSRRRVTTDQIGMARLRDGTELVRIGSPLRPEFAAWRYGDQFGRRRRRQILLAGAGLTGVGVIAVGGAWAGASFGAFGWAFGRIADVMVNGRPNTVVARVRTETEGTVSVRRRHLGETRLVPGADGPLALELRFKGGQTRLEGREALRAASILMPHVNRFGGKRNTIDSAVGMLERSGGAEGYFEHLARHASDDTWVAEPIKKRRSRRHMYRKTGLFGLVPQDRLALEMALHEEAELRALRGELAELETAWREAEEIAAIADDLLVPSGISNTLQRLRLGAG